MHQAIFQDAFLGALKGPQRRAVVAPSMWHVVRDKIDVWCETSAFRALLRGD